MSYNQYAPYFSDTEDIHQHSSSASSNSNPRSIIGEIDGLHCNNTRTSQPLHHVFSAQADLSRSASCSPHPCYHTSNSLSTTSPSLQQLLSNSNFPDTSTYPNRSDPLVGVKSIFSGTTHTLLLTYSGEVYGWGDNDCGQVVFQGLDAIKSPIKSPIKLPLANITSISAGLSHYLAISSSGNLYGWGCNRFNQINMSSIQSLPITPIQIPYNMNQIHSGACFSLALTKEGQVVKWGEGKSFEVIEGLDNIDFLCVDGDAFIAIDSVGNYFYCDEINFFQIPVNQYFTPREPFKGFLSSIGGIWNNVYLFIIDTNGVVWKFNKGDDKDPFKNKPTKVPGLSNVVSINGCRGIFTAIDSDGKVFVWGSLRRMSEDFEDFEDCDKPIRVQALTNIEGFSVGDDFLFAYNENTVWAWGRNDKGQLGTGDWIHRHRPVKVFGDEYFKILQYPKQPLDRMFSCLIKLVYWEYLNYLQEVYEYHPYFKGFFYTKCGISKRVAQFAQEVFNVHPFRNKMFLKDPEDFNLNENICELQLRFVTGYSGPTVINTRIKKLDVYYDDLDTVEYDPQFFSLFPNVEVIKLAGGPAHTKILSLNIPQLSKLKCLELTNAFEIEPLPTSLVKLVLGPDYIEVSDLSYLTSLIELVALYDAISYNIFASQIALSQTIFRFEFQLDDPADNEIQLFNLKELLIHGYVPGNITEQNFPSLKFIQVIAPDEDSLSGSTLSPTKLINQGLIKSVTLIKNEYLAELSCFPWWIQYSAERYVIDIFRDFVGKDYEYF
ncbi:hypothetical protein P9112_013330 [Eukaryota sp. TZLM1-RC]